jgi:hypothetical protein
MGVFYLQPIAILAQSACRAQVPRVQQTEYERARITSIDRSGRISVILLQNILTSTQGK